MSKLIIMTDSNSGITQEEAKKLGIFAVPMPVIVNGEEYLEDITISQSQFYEFLKNNADVKTSQPSRAYLEDTWKELLKTHEDIVYIPMSSGLSGTCANAQNYAKGFKGKVQVVDNKRISLTQKESVMEALAMAQKGKSAVDIKKYLESTKSRASIYIILNTLKYIKKGGRISPAVAVLGEMLKIKPVLYTRGDEFKKFTMSMSVKQAEKKVLEQIGKELETEFKKEYDAGCMTISLAYTYSDDEAKRFKADLINAYPKLKFHYIDALSLSVACHIGPDALGIAMSVNNYMKEDVKKSSKPKETKKSDPKSKPKKKVDKPEKKEKPAKASKTEKQKAAKKAKTNKSKE